MENNSNVYKLEGSKNRWTTTLRGHGWLDVVEVRAVKPKSSTERSSWDANDAKAQTLIITRMTEEITLHILPCTTSSEIWTKLHNVYEQKSETGIHIVQ